MGGRHLLTGTFELERDLPGNFGVAAFADAGNAFDQFSNYKRLLAVAVGVGFRWRLPGVTIGVDLAKAVHTPALDSIPGLHVHLNISPRL